MLPNARICHIAVRSHLRGATHSRARFNGRRRRGVRLFRFDICRVLNLRALRRER